MVRQIAPVEKRASSSKFVVASTAATAPLATSGVLLGQRDLGGASKQELTVSELMERSYSTIDENNRPRRVPVLKNGRWVTEELASAPKAKCQHVTASTPTRTGGSSSAHHLFELSFEGSVSLGISFKELDGSAPRVQQPPSGFRVLVGAVQPGSLASQQRLKAGVAVMSINGQSLRGQGRKDALRILGMAGKGKRTIAFLDFEGDNRQSCEQPHSPTPLHNSLTQERARPPAVPTLNASVSEGTIEVPPPVDTKSTAARLEALFGALTRVFSLPRRALSSTLCSTLCSTFCSPRLESLSPFPPAFLAPRLPPPSAG